jgi:histidine triad (HIT) family protein
MVNDCVFCQIIQGKLPAYKVYENEHFIAVLDANPVVIGHVILISKRHCGGIADLTAGELGALGPAIGAITKQIKAKSEASFSIYNTSGEGASQSVPHFHFHIIPRRIRDRLWLKSRSRIVLDKSSGFRRLTPDMVQQKAIWREFR